jgi:hypothetical protein
LVWVHAFRRADEAAIVRVLRDGPQIHPDETNDTRVYEGRLGIAPNRVYAYVGRTLETFGENALVLPPAAVRGGHLTPFDTGGTIRKIRPIDDFPDPEKAAYVAAFTWTLPEDLAACLETYPTGDATRLAAYLDTAKPDGRGPGDLWPGKPDAAIWEQNTDWRAWTWEGRAEPHHLAIDQLRHWTCSPSVANGVFATAKRLYGATDRPFLLRLTKTYLEGGVGSMLLRLRKDQAA